jgi:hypothetical protein
MMKLQDRPYEGVPCLEIEIVPSDGPHRAEIFPPIQLMSEQYPVLETTR